MFRKLMGVFAGILVAVITVMILEAIGHQIYPPPEGMNFKDPKQLHAYMAEVPVGALLAVLIAWCAGAFLGGITAAWTNRHRPWPFAALVIGLVLAGAVGTLMATPHPLWFTLLSLILIPLTILPAVRLVENH